ncbi:MAG: hemagglutinin repeat-containing protein, partial [Enterobacteriaceae bacterium]
EQALLLAESRLTATLTGLTDNSGGTLVGQKAIQLRADALSNREGKLQSGQDLQLTIRTDTDNRGGLVSAGNDFLLDGGEQGDSGTFNNQGGKLLAGNQLSLQATGLDNSRQGEVQSLQALTLRLRDHLDNQSGTVGSGSGLSVRAGSLDNREGWLQTLDTLDLQLARTLDNRQGNLLSQKQQQVKAETIDNRQGLIGSQESLQLTATGLDNRSGEVISQQTATLTLDSLDNRQGKVQSAGGLMLSIGREIQNQAGKISAQHDLIVQQWQNRLAALHNLSGQLLAGQQLRLNLARADNQSGGLLYSQQAMHLTLSGHLDNREGRLLSGDSLTLSAASLTNQQGEAESQKQLSIAVTGLLDNRDGRLRSNLGQTLSAFTLDNQGGLVSALGALSVTGDRLDNRGGVLLSQGAAQYQLTQLNNQQGKVHSGGTLDLSVQETINNQGGELISTQAQTLSGTSVDNSQGGKISSQQSLSLSARTLDNSEGGSLTATGNTLLTLTNLNNNQGKIHSGGTLELSGLTDLDNRAGSLLSNGALHINTPDLRYGLRSAQFSPVLTLLNQGGSVQSGSSLNVTAASLFNQGGTLSSQGDLTLTLQQDYTHQQGDTLSSNSALRLTTTGNISNLAEWLIQGSVFLQSANFSNLATLASARALTIITGTLKNQSRLEAPQLTLTTDVLDNQDAIISDQITVNSRILDNHGSEAVIAATDSVTLTATERLTNRDSALVYSVGQITLNSSDLIENLAADIEAEGDISITTVRLDNKRIGLEIARQAQTSSSTWNKYNYYWRSFGSKGTGDITPTTQTLKFRDDASAQSRYGTILEINPATKQALIRFQGDKQLWVYYEALRPNADGSYNMTFFEGRACKGWGETCPYQQIVWREYKGYPNVEQWDPNRHVSAAQLDYMDDLYNFRERTWYVTRITDKVVSAGRESNLLAGGKMNIVVPGRLVNDASTISANGDVLINGVLNGKGDERVVNQGYSINELVQETTVDHYDKHVGKHWYLTYARDPKSNVIQTIDSLITSNGNISITTPSLENTTVNQATISAAEAAKAAAAAERAEWESNPLKFTLPDAQLSDTGTDRDTSGGRLTEAELALTQKKTVDPLTLKIPDNALFRPDYDPSASFLIVTDPRFTSLNNFLSSDYMLQRLGYDPAAIHKRLGDGYYEQRVVREQMLMLTGRLSTQGQSAMAQYTELMNNGITVAQNFNLTLGIALTPAQIAALQQDIVWMVTETVQTANGPQTVLMPKVYLASTTLQLTGDGAVIAGKSLNLSTQSIANAGNMYADNALSVQTDTFNHSGGDIRADSIAVAAETLNLSTNLQNAIRQANMDARKINLSATDILLEGARLTAQETLSLAASNNLTLTTARSQRDDSIEIAAGRMGSRGGNYENIGGSGIAHVSGQWQNALGSTLLSQGNLNLSAGQDVTLKGSSAGAAGVAQVTAGGNINLLADTTTNYMTL